MKAFARRLCSMCLIIGFSGLLTFIGGVNTLLGSSPAAYADTPSCPQGYHIVQEIAQKACMPNAAYYCPQGQIWSPKDNSCISEDSNPNKCNPGLTWQDPDNAQQCIPVSRECGSASNYDPDRKLCIVQPPKPM